MPTEHILSLLVAERDKLNRAIEGLQGSAEKRNEPLKNVVVVAASFPVAASAVPTTRWTAAQKRARAARMKARWAKQNSEASKNG